MAFEKQERSLLFFLFRSFIIRRPSIAHLKRRRSETPILSPWRPERPAVRASAAPRDDEYELSELNLTCQLSLCLSHRHTQMLLKPLKTCFQNFLTTFASCFYNLNQNTCSFILPILLPGQTTWHPQCNLATNSWAGDRGEEAGHVASSHQTSSPPSVWSSAPTDVTQVTSLEAFYRESQAALFTILFPDTLDVSHWWTSGYVCVCKRSDSKVNPPLSLHLESHAESWLAH